MVALTVVISMVAVMAMVATYSDLTQDRKISVLKEEIQAMNVDISRCRLELFNMLRHW